MPVFRESVSSEVGPLRVVRRIEESRRVSVNLDDLIEFDTEDGRGVAIVRIIVEGVTDTNMIGISIGLAISEAGDRQGRVSSVTLNIGSRLGQPHIAYRSAPYDCDEATYSVLKNRVAQVVRAYDAVRWDDLIGQE